MPLYTVPLKTEKFLEMVGKEFPDVKAVGWRLNGDEIDIICEEVPTKPKSKPKPKSESEDE